MEPKFQSSFIPKTPIDASFAGTAKGAARTNRSLTGFIGSTIFILSLLTAGGMFGYKYFLNYRIGQMGHDLETARATLDPGAIMELTDLSNRIIATKEIVSKHRILSPFFDQLERDTAKTVRFKGFRFNATERGLEVIMQGEARGYAALALQSDIFNKSDYLVEPYFTDLMLNEKGDVNFTFTALINPDLLSYQKVIESQTASQVPTLPATLPVNNASTTSASSTTP